MTEIFEKAQDSANRAGELEREFELDGRANRLDEPRLEFDCKAYRAKGPSDIVLMSGDGVVLWRPNTLLYPLTESHA